MTTHNDEQPEGGHAWELSAASRKLAAAVGNEAAGEAALDLAAAITNGAMAPLISSLETVLRTVVRKEVGTIERRMIDADRATVDYRLENTTLLNHRFDNFGAELDQIAAKARELRDGQAVLQAEFQTVGEALTQLQLDFVSLSAEVAQVSAELGRSREHRARLQAAVDRIEAQMLAPGERERLIVQHDELLGQVVVLETRIAVIEARLAALLPEAAT